jgi:hypothetical protein
MKTFIILLMVLAGYSLRAQTGPTGQEFKTPTPHISNPATVLIPPLKPNEIAGTSPAITYSGVLVQAVKTDNPLQLINPFAPARYGNGGDNVDHDIITGKENGLKFFSIGF